MQSNVLIDADGRACIADFGLSTILDEIGGSTFATSSTGKTRGTLRWGAPELLGILDHEDAKAQHIGPTIQSDIYSFGGIMLQVCDVAVLHYFSQPMTTHTMLGRFCQEKYRIITIPAMRRSLVRSLEGRPLHGQMIHVSQTVDGNSFDGVGLLSGLLFSGLLVRRLSHFQLTILSGTLRIRKAILYLVWLETSLFRLITHLRRYTPVWVCPNTHALYPCPCYSALISLLALIPYRTSPCLTLTVLRANLTPLKNSRVAIPLAKGK